jgi:signal transduction histidine kinase
MRSLIFELRPGSLADDGLIRALRTHTAAVQGRLGLPIVFTADEMGRLPIETEEALYRIAQEALHNVVKHAGATRVRVSVRQDGETVRLEVEDNGAGFDPTRTEVGHLGLAGMRARTERIGGRLTVTSRGGKGTCLRVDVPMAEAAPAEPSADAIPVSDASPVVTA